MRIVMVGTGYVGLVTGACFAEFGFQVICVDKNKEKINALKKGNIPIYEPGLEELINKNKNRLFFENSLRDSVENADIIFISVGTPSSEINGEADLSFVFAAAKEINEYVKENAVIVVKSTVPVGSAREVSKIFKLNEVVSNPEFLREGSAIEDFMRPDRVVIGVKSESAKEVMQHLYRPLSLLETPIVFTDFETAELIKYASNTFLATKVSFINQLADLAETCGADIQQVSIAMGLDKRIGKQFLQAGPGFGGSCFPKDVKALIAFAKKIKVSATIAESVDFFNENRKKNMAQKIISACKGSVKNKNIAILGLTFKPDTDDIRESPSLVIIPILQKAGANISSYDPSGYKEVENVFNNVRFCKDPYDASEKADAIVILTEWNEFKALDFNKLKDIVRTPVLIDLRNIYLNKKIEGFSYICVGRKSSYIDDSILQDMPLRCKVF